MKRLFKSIGFLACLLLFIWGGYTNLLYYFVRPYITIVGSACLADGIGRQSVELLAELQAQVTVDFIPTTKTCLKDIPKDIQKNFAIDIKSWVELFFLKTVYGFQVSLIINF